jgi:beta-glucosidase
MKGRPAMDTYRDPAAAIEDRVVDLLGRMTLDEKVAQLSCLWLTLLLTGDALDLDVVRQRFAHGMGQVARIGASTGLHPAEVAELSDRIQRVAVEETRLGIPVIVHEESTGGLCARDATVFPQALGLASTWDPELVGSVAGIIRDQMLAVGARQTLAPVLDIARDPRWGRVEETYGEDPVLAGAIGTAYVRGLQTADLADGVTATGKHFLAYGRPEGGMNHAPVHLGPRELREVYAEPFAAAIRDAGLASVMNSYSSIDGLPCAGSAEILTGLLRDELGFDGVVVADYFAVALLRTHHRVAETKGGAAARALTAGLDVELPSLDCFGAPLREELDAGRLGINAVDEAVRRVLRLKLRLGLFERPYARGAARAHDGHGTPADGHDTPADAYGTPADGYDTPADVYDTPADRALARRAVTESTILLTNDGSLPLAPDARVAVIGPGADDQRLLQGDYHYPAHTEIVYETAPRSDLLPGPFFTPHVTPLAGIRAVAPSATHTPGCEVTGDDRTGFPAAVAAAREAEVAVVVVAGRSGLQPACTVGEARDATDLDLTGVQGELVAAVAATGTPTVVVVLSGRVHTLGPVTEQAAATLVLWPPGEEGGHGLADVLFGAADPGGRLPVTLPRSVGQIPIHSGRRAGGGRSEFHGDYTDSPTTPLFPFGHGLSYTTFEYGELEIEAGSTASPSPISVRITNTGDRPGSTVVQLYVTDDVAPVARPQRALAGFVRLTLDQGQARTVHFELHPTRLAFFDEAMRFVTEPGSFTVDVGASSGDIRLTGSLDLTGPVVESLQRHVVATTARVV